MKMADVAIIDDAAMGVRNARRLPAFAFVSAMLACALGASTLVAPRGPANAAIPVNGALRAQISDMSTGATQSVVQVGKDAVERNALIPTSSLAVGRMGGFTAIGVTSPSYATAQKCLTQAIYYEAANEPTQGKRAVAQVVLNRVRHPAYPDSVCGVVYEGANARVCQFSFTCDGSLLRAPMARQWEESRRIAAEALAGAVAPEVGTATNYHADYVVPRWAFTLGKLVQIGRHIFYRLPGSIGSAGAFSDRWTGIEHIPTLDFARLRAQLSARLSSDESAALPDLVPGLTVTREASDRHAMSDVGGRLDTTTAWRLTVPDPSEISDGYRRTLSGQGAAAMPSASADAPGASGQTSAGI